MTTQMTLDPKATSLAPWQLDPAHTEVEFSVRHLMISNVKGRFGKVAGSIVYDQQARKMVSLGVDIETASVDTRVEPRDQHLRSADFFDAEKHPKMVFKGRRIQGDVNDAFKLVGDLTIRGTTREVTLDVTLEGSGNDPWGNERRGYSATGKIDRRDFGLTWNQAIEAGGIAVGNEVKIVINTELMRPLPKE
ncbi:MAG: YceI family protein [Gemmatimonadales bacterium]